MNACSTPEDVPDPNDIADAMDVHTYAHPQEARIDHLTLQLSVDFDQLQLSGFAEYQISRDSAATQIILDIHHLLIDSVWAIGPRQQQSATFSVGQTRDFLGAPLTIDLPLDAHTVRIYYKTTPESLALQWLNPGQTHDKEHPFLFTQGQAILTRTWIPCQDSPGIRYTYEATISVPPGLIAVMSASNPQEMTPDGQYTFKMNQPIPAYLMALAVGDLSFQAISDRTGVYAEPGMLGASAYEMADLEKMVKATESLYGPYQWERFDLIVLPPSFPFGGMENPRLTFATPTIIAGDRSLTALVAHELAHSWSGNLVTNATWDDFWLNEGHTVYLERRIMETLYGVDYSNMLALLGYQDLERTIVDLGDQSSDTHLKLSLDGRDPDDGMTDIAYEKGYLLLRTLEEKVGRQIFDDYLKQYFKDYQFRSISTEQWAAYIYKHLIHEHKIDLNLDGWLYNPGIPIDHAQIQSRRFRQVNQRIKEFTRIGRLDKSNTRNWSTHEWLHFIRHIPSDLHISFYEKLDDVFELSNSGNSEILAVWLELSIRSQYMPSHNRSILDTFLTNVGRRKFLTPLYKALLETNQLELAESIFNKARNNYHSVSDNSIAALIADHKQPG
ncbi:MAG: M1 family metallopeptidase [Saprospiraceae bacterium]|nr:M1 family metallopeptidase [Saprospiraceae bacterium]